MPTLRLRSSLVEILLVAATALLGLAKVHWQRNDPPSWARAPDNVYDGYVAIDAHAHRAAVIRDWLRGEPGAGRAMRQWFSEEPAHPTTLAPPLCIALLALVVGSVPVAFLTANCLVFLAATFLVRLLAAEAARSASPNLDADLVGRLAVCCFAAHCLTVRTAIQLHLDYWVAVAALTTVWCTIRWALHGKARFAVGIGAACTLGVFTKASFLPLLAVPTLGLLLLAPTRRFSRIALTLACSLAPALAALAFVVLLRSAGTSTSDFQQLASSWSLTRTQLSHFVVEMLLLFQLLPAAWSWRDLRREPVVRLLGIVAGSVLASTWLMNLPAVPRLYVFPEALLVILACHGLLARFGWSARIRTAVIVWCVLNYAIAAIGLLTS